MDFILSYNNNEGVMVFPVILNGSVRLETEQNNPVFEGLSGQMQALGATRLAEFSVESIFPLHSYSWVRPGSWADGWRYVETINAVRLRRIPFRAIWLDDRGREIFNLPVSVESFSYGLDEARDISYKLAFREYRFGYAPKVAGMLSRAVSGGAEPSREKKETVTILTDAQAAERA